VVRPAGVGGVLSCVDGAATRSQPARAAADPAVAAGPALARAVQHDEVCSPGRAASSRRGAST